MLPTLQVGVVRLHPFSFGSKGFRLELLGKLSSSEGSKLAETMFRLVVWILAPPDNCGKVIYLHLVRLG